MDMHLARSMGGETGLKVYRHGYDELDNIWFTPDEYEELKKFFATLAAQEAGVERARVLTEREVRRDRHLRRVASEIKRRQRSAA